MLALFAAVLKLFSIGAAYMQRKGMLSDAEAIIITNATTVSLWHIENSTRVRSSPVAVAADGLRGKPSDFRD